jgi:hypothetical protein
MKRSGASLRMRQRQVRINVLPGNRHASSGLFKLPVSCFQQVYRQDFDKMKPGGQGFAAPRALQTVPRA